MNPPLVRMNRPLVRTNPPLVRMNPPLVRMNRPLVRMNPPLVRMNPPSPPPKAYAGVSTPQGGQRVDGGAAAGVAMASGGARPTVGDLAGWGGLRPDGDASPATRDAAIRAAGDEAKPLRRGARLTFVHFLFYSIHSLVFSSGCLPAAHLLTRSSIFGGSGVAFS
eukprot:4156730-Pyramimonas_sp.AAC.1